MAGADFAGNCPKCRGSRWLCHWLKKDCSTREPGEVTAPGQVITPRKELLPLKPNGNSTPGPKIPTIPDDLIKELSSQGLGAKAIASRLAEQGVVVSAMTIHRRLQGSFL
jgi:hypothetical protein